MFIDINQELILMTIGAFLLGWILSSISARMGKNSGRANKRDPRDDRIRSLEAELRIAQTDFSETTMKLETTEQDLEDALDSIDKRDNVINHQQERVEGLKKDLKESVHKTRQLRHELQERATENVRTEARMREVETELSIAQASTDLIATGVLDYEKVPEEGANEDVSPGGREAGSAKP